MAQSKALVTHISLLSTLLSRFQEHVARGIDKKFRVGNSLVVDKATRKGKAHGRAPSKTIVAMNEYVTVWKDYPRNTDFYEPMIHTFGKLGPHCLDTTISLLLEWLPDHCKRYSTLRAANPSYGTIEEYVFTTFLRKLNLDASDNRGMDLVRCAVDLAVADTIAYLLTWFDGTNLGQTTAVTLHELGIHFQRQIDPTFIPHAEFYRGIRTLIANQWAVIIGQVSNYGAGVSASEMVGKCTKESDTDILHCYRGLRLLRVNLAKSEANAIQYLEQLCTAIDNQKSKLLRVELLTALEGALLSMDWGDNHRVDTIVQGIGKKCSKWMKTDELEGIAARIQAAMLVHGGFSQFEEQFDTMVGKKLFKKATGAKTFAKRQDFLTAVLIMLRGKYTGDRLGWMPSGDSHHPIGESPYSFVLLGETPSRLMARLKLIHTLLFQKKPLAKNADHGSAAVAVEIVMQIAAHSLSFVKSTILDYLLYDKTVVPVHRVIGLRVLHRVFSLSPSFWSVAGWRDGGHSCLKASEHGVSQADLTSYFQKAIDDMIDGAVSQASLAHCGLASDALPVSCITRTCELPPRQYEYEFVPDDQSASFASLKVSECVSRWHDAVRDADTSRMIGRERERFSAKKVSESLAAWNAPEQDQWHAVGEGIDPSRTAPHVREELKDRLHIELLIALTKSVALAPTNKVIAQFVDADAFIGQFLIHSDPDLASATSAALQQLMLAYPEHRGAIFQGMIGLLLKPKSAELPSYCLETLLSHLVLLTDMWVSLCTQSVGGGKASPEKPPQHMIEEGDAVALLCLCHSSSTIRCLAIQFSNSLHALADSSSANETLACLIFMSGEHISHRARYRYLLEISQQPKPEVVIDENLPCPPVDVIACGDNNLLWSLTLAEMVISITNASLSFFPLVKEQILQRLGFLSAYSGGIQSRVLCLNYHITLFAGLHRKDPDSQVQTFLDYLSGAGATAGYWSNLLSEGEAFEDVLLASGCVNGSATTLVVKNAWNWYQELPAKKQRPKARLPITRLVRTIVRHDEFHRVQQLGELGTTSLVLNEVLPELQSFLDSVPPPRNLHGPVFVSFAQMVNSTATGLFRRLDFCSEGPLRQQIQPSMPEAITWKAEDRVKILETLHLWATTSSSVPQADIAKAVAQIKDPKQKEERRAELESAAKAIPEHARHAFTALCRLCPLFVNRHVPQKYVDWAIKVEELGSCTVRWLLAFQLEVALPIFIDQCYGSASQRKKCSIFINAVLDQYVPFEIVEDVPHKGQPEDIMQHQRHHIMQASDGSSCLPLSEASIQFSKTTNEHAGRLIFMLFLNTTNPQPRVRERTFKALARLVPFSFGRDQTIPNSERSAKLLEEIALISPLFRSALVEEYTEAARVIARMSAQFKRYTNEVFAEAFNRMFQVSSQASKHWALEILLPWCSNVDLAPAEDDKYKLTCEPEEFLGLFFKNFTMDIVEDDSKLPHSLIALWQALASAKPGNFQIVVRFLLKKAIETEPNFAICASLVSYLYRSQPNMPLDIIIHPLTIDGELGDNGSPAAQDSGEESSTGHCFWNVEDGLAERYRLLCTVLANFAVDSPSLFLPHVHHVLMWCLLRLSIKSERDHLANLFVRTVELVLTLLKRARFNANGVLAKFSHITSYVSFSCNNFRWSCSKYDKESVMTKANSLPHAVQAEPATLDGVEVVAVLQGCFTVLGLSTINRSWCYTALSWAARHKDPQVKLIGKQVACTVLVSCGDVGGITRLLQRDLLSSLQNLQLMLDRSVARAIQAGGSPSSENPALAVPLLRGAVIETIKTLQVAVPHLLEDREVEQLLQMFWCGSAILRNSHPAFSVVINEVLNLIFQLTRGGLFLLPEVGTFFDQQCAVLNSSPDWYFKGLLPLVLQYIYQPASEQIALIVFVQIMGHPSSPLLHLAAGNFEVALTCIIPWMHGQLLTGDITLDGTASVACKGIVDALLALYNVKEVVGLFTSFMTGQYNSKADQFVDDAAKILGPLALPKCAGAIADMFTVIMRIGPPKCITSVLRFTQALLRVDGKACIDNFVNLIKHCCTITGTAYQVCSDTLLQTMLLTMEGNSNLSVTSASQPLKSTQLQTTMRMNTAALQKLTGYAELSLQDFAEQLQPADTSGLIVPIAFMQLSQMPSLVQQQQMQREQIIHLHQYQQQMHQQQIAPVQPPPQQQPESPSGLHSSISIESEVGIGAEQQATGLQSPEPSNLDVDDALMQLDMLESSLSLTDEPLADEPKPVVTSNPFLDNTAVFATTAQEQKDPPAPKGIAPSPPKPVPQKDVNMFDLDPLEMMGLEGEDAALETISVEAAPEDTDTLVLCPDQGLSASDMDTIVLTRKAESPNSMFPDVDDEATIVIPAKTAASISLAAAPANAAPVPTEPAPVPDDLEEELEDFHFSDGGDEDESDSATETAEASDFEDEDPLQLMDELLAKVQNEELTAKPEEDKQTTIKVISNPAILRVEPDDDKTIVVPAAVSEEAVAAVAAAAASQSSSLRDSDDEQTIVIPRDIAEKVGSQPVVIAKPQVRRAVQDHTSGAVKATAPLKDTVDVLLGDIDLQTSSGVDDDDIDGDFDKLAEMASTLMHPAPAPPQGEDEEDDLDDLLDALDALDQFQ